VFVPVVFGLGKTLGEVSRCSMDDVGRDVRCPSSARLLLAKLGETFPDCCVGVGLVIPTCKGLKASSNEP
jgi:hypothetical protein